LVVYLNPSKWDAAPIGASMKSTNIFKTFRSLKMTNLKSPPRPSKYTGLTPIDNPSHRERDDNYQGVIVQLAPRWRIIECRDAIQWIIQKRSAEPLNPGYWLGASYVTDRNKLIELSTTLGLLSEPSLRAVLEALPSSVTELRK
jgi:hypothetical protein